MTPQERWQAFTARLPHVRWWQKALVILALLALLLIIVPFVLPLGGPEAVPAQSLADPNGAFIRLEDGEIYLIHQAGAGDPVLLIHGFGGSVVDWQALLPHLHGYDVYAVDLLGAGLSEKSLLSDMSHPAQAERLIMLLDKLGLDSAHVVGHDMGGNIAVHLAQSHPERLKSLTLMSASLQYVSSAGLPAAALDFPVTQRWARVLVRWVLPASVEINLQSAMEQDTLITPELIADYGRAYRTPNWDLAILALARDNPQSALTQPLQDLRLPTLILWGEADGWISPATAEQLARDMPHAERLMLPDVGHLPALEAPEAVANGLIEFWDSIQEAPG